MTSFEWLAVTYFAALALAGARRRRPRGFLYVIGAMLLVIVARFAAPWDVRAWLPHAYLVLGYWIPAAFAPATLDVRFQQWLERADARLLPAKAGSHGSSKAGSHGASNAGSPGTSQAGSPGASQAGSDNAHLVASGFSRKTLHVFELAYLLCYPLVPVAFTVVFVLGTRTDITRFWLAVLIAGYACYGTLPWTAAHPPRIVARDEHARRGVAKINTFVLGRMSHNLNTFPSGHVAVSLAAALVVWPLSALWGWVLLLSAIAIAVAAVAGRYHYLVDVLVGLGVGCLAALTAALAIVRNGSG